jgi:hypothetical protein
MKKSVFIGSSSESVTKKIVTTINALIREDDAFEAHPWFYTATPGNTIIESLEENLEKHQYAVFVATPDDTLSKGNAAYTVMRDNVLFELGMFVGKHGRNKAILLLPKDMSSSLPSDLGGVIYISYDYSQHASLVEDSNRLKSFWSTHTDTILSAFRKACRNNNAKHEKMAALNKLNAVTYTLSSIMLGLAPNVIYLIFDEKKFRESKKNLSESITTILEEFIVDAKILGVEDELKDLVNAAVCSISEMPSPDILSLIGNSFKDATDAFKMAADIVMGGRSAMDAFKQSVASKASSLSGSYNIWVQGSRKSMENAVNNFNYALRNAGAKLQDS